MARDDLPENETSGVPPESGGLAEPAASQALSKALQDLAPEGASRSLGDLLGGLAALTGAGSASQQANAALAGLDLNEIVGKRGGKQILVKILMEKLHLPQQTAETLADTVLQALKLEKKTTPRRRKQTTSKPKPATSQTKPKRPSSTSAKKESSSTKRKTGSSTTKKTSSSTAKKPTSSTAKKPTSSTAKKPTSSTTKKPTSSKSTPSKTEK